MFKWGVVLLSIVMPYFLVGEQFGSVCITVGAFLILLLNRKELDNVALPYTVAVLFFIVVSGCSLFINSEMYAINGFLGYVNMLLYIFVFASMFKDKKIEEKALEIGMYIIGAITLLFLLTESLFIDGRFSGWIGYGNTMALLLLVSICLLDTVSVKGKEWLHLIFISGILFTESRTTLILLVLYCLFHIAIKKNKGIFLILFFAFCNYIVIKQWQFGGLLLLPLILVFLPYALKGIRKLSNMYFYILMTLCVGSVFFLPINLIERIKNISLYNGSLQERFISFSDAWNSITSHPFGVGLNTYGFKQFATSTAYYDHTYLHNSILHVLFEIGWIGGIAFIGIFLAANMVIIQGESPYKNVYLFIVNSIFLHSLLDFDIAFSTILIVVSFIVVVGGRVSYSINLRRGALFFIVGLVISLYVFAYEGAVEISKKLNMDIGIATFFPHADYRAFLARADVQFNLYQANKSKEHLQQAKKFLLVAERKNEESPLIKGNLGYVYEQLGNYEKSRIYQEKTVEINRFFPGAYKVYNQFLEQHQEYFGNKKYDLYQNDLRKHYEESKKRLDPRAKYLNNQVGDRPLQNSTK